MLSGFVHFISVYLRTILEATNLGVDIQTVWIWGLYIPIPVVHPDMPVWPGVLVWSVQTRWTFEVSDCKCFMLGIPAYCYRLLGYSSKPPGTHRIPWIRSRFELTGLGIRIHHYKIWSSTKNSTWVFQHFISIQKISLYYKTFSNYKIIDFQSTPVSCHSQKTHPAKHP